MSLIAVLGFGACGKGLETQMQKHLESYYPSSRETRYKVNFDGGFYDIYTTGSAKPKSAGVDARYDGYIVARPNIKNSTRGQAYWTYLVTPGGKVWRRIDSGEIPASGHHMTELLTIQDTVTTTITQTVNSHAEPVIEDFLDNPEGWSLYGVLESEGINKFRLKHVTASDSNQARRTHQ